MSTTLIFVIGLAIGFVIGEMVLLGLFMLYAVFFRSGEISQANGEE